MHNFAARYAVEHDLEPSSVAQHRFALTSLERFAGKSLEIGDISDELVNEWLGALMARKLSRTTVRSYRTRMLTLWRAAAEQGLCEPPGRVRKIKRQRPLVVAWSDQQCRCLLIACDFLIGRFPNGVERAAVMRSLVLLGWYTGLRPGDWLQLRPENIRDDGILIRQAKTCQPIACPVPPHAIAEIRACVRGPGPVFPIREYVLRKWFARIVRGAGLRGSPKYLRRSSATAVEIAQPGAATLHLGHQTPGLAQERYIDMQLVLASRQRPMPPPLQP